MNLNISLADWVNHRKPAYKSLVGVTVVTMGDDDTLSPPFLAFYETSSEQFVQGDVPMYGVSTIEITAELQTVPVSPDQDGTSPDQERQMRRDIYDIVGDRLAIEWMEFRNNWRVFDIRMASPTTEPTEERRISRWVITAVACPI